MKATLEGWMRRGQKRKERALQSSTVGRGAHRSPEGLTDHQRGSPLTRGAHRSSESQSSVNSPGTSLSRATISIPSCIWPWPHLPYFSKNTSWVLGNIAVLIYSDQAADHQTVSETKAVIVGLR